MLSVQGISQAIRKKAKPLIEAHKDKQRFEQELKAKVLKAKRESYSKEAVKQARLKAKMQAKLKYNPPKPKQPSQTLFAGLPQQSAAEQKKKKEQFNKMLWEL